MSTAAANSEAYLETLAAVESRGVVFIVLRTFTQSQLEVRNIRRRVLNCRFSKSQPTMAVTANPLLVNSPI